MRSETEEEKQKRIIERYQLGLQEEISLKEDWAKIMVFLCIVIILIILFGFTIWLFVKHTM